MKHLLIILSFLLLSSPVIGDNHKGETLYGWITSSSTLEWKGFGDKESHPIYKGDVENGKPSGLGVITFPDGSKFVGEYKDGEKNGQGTFTFSWGGKYEGEYKDGKQNGQGTKLTLVEVCMLVNGRMGENMVKEHTLNMVLSFTLMGENMWGNTRMGKSGMEHITTITGKKNTSW